MESVRITKSFIVLLLLYFNSSAQGAPNIVAPYPDNVYAIEDEVAKVTCVVEDTVSNPDEIIFVRKSRFGDVEPIRDEGPDGRIYYQNETLDGGRKLRVTLHFNKVIINDDSRNGVGYECQGHTGGSQHEYGFTVTVIERSELPGIEVSNNVSAQFGDNIVLSCNLTISQAASAGQTKLTNLMWAKDGRLIEEILYPREQSLKSLKIYVDRPEVGGIYTCHLTSKLRNVKEYNVTGNIYVSVQPRFFPEKKEEKNVNRLVCTAQGNPLVTEWKRKSLLNDDIWVFDTKDNSSKGKYVFSNMDGFKDHTLTIYDVQPKDAGQYYCCIKNITSPRPPEDISDCQIFDVQPPDMIQQTILSLHHLVLTMANSCSDLQYPKYGKTSQLLLKTVL